jgi:hypothetical protein
VPWRIFGIKSDEIIKAFSIFTFHEMYYSSDKISATEVYYSSGMRQTHVMFYSGIAV